MDSDLTSEVWQRLIEGQSFADLGLPLMDGRTDLRGLIAEGPSVRRDYVTEGMNVSSLDRLIELRGVHWNGLDFSEARLKSLRFFDCVIENCVFDKAICHDWRLWGTVVSNCTFQSVDLRKSALAGIDKGKRNSYRSVDFTHANLRQTSYVSADFMDCVFCDAGPPKILRREDRSQKREVKKRSYDLRSQTSSYSNGSRV